MAPSSNKPTPQENTTIANGRKPPSSKTTTTTPNGHTTSPSSPPPKTNSEHHHHQHQRESSSRRESDAKRNRSGSETNSAARQRHESDTESTESYEYYIPSPPDGGWGWVIVGASLFCNLVVDGLGYSFGVFLLEFSDYFRESKSKVSLVGSLLCGVYLFAGPLVSALINKFGCRPVAVAGSVVASLAFLLSTMAPSVDVLIITYGVMGGFGLGMIYLPSIVSVGYYFEKRRALATGIAVCGSGIGTFIFAPLSEFLLEELDWKSALVVISGITLNAAVCGMLMRPLQPSSLKSRPRAKNLMDRLKEQTNMNRTPSENGIHQPFYPSSSPHHHNDIDANAVLERVMEAKLLREKRLQEDDSELGSLPSIFLVRQQSNKDSSASSRKDLRVHHKLSLSDHGEAGGGGSGSLAGGSPLREGSTSRMSSSLMVAPTSLSILAEGSSSGGANNGPEDTAADPQRHRGADESSGYETTDVSRSTERERNSENGGGGERINKDQSVAKDTEDSPSPDVISASDTFVDADSGTFGENDNDDGTNTDRSRSECFVTPPTSPPLASCSPTTPTPRERGDGEEEGEGKGLVGERGVGRTNSLGPAVKNGLVLRNRKSDPAVTKLLAHSAKELRNGSVPSNMHHHVHEVIPLLEVPDRKTTMVNLGSEKNLWRLKTLRSPATTPTPLAGVGHSLVSLSVSKKDLARPLYRKDIFYSGSVTQLPLFRSQPDMKSYITSITTIPGEPALVGKGEGKVWRYLCLPRSAKDTLQEMLDLSLLRDRAFLLVCLGNVLTFLGFYVPFVFSVDLAVSLGVSKSKAAFLISVIGITNTVGRVVTGWLADLRKINSLVITYVSIFVCGLSTALFPFCTSYGLLCAAASLFGLSVAAFISLSSILICDLLGLEKLTNGFGLMSLFRGMAAMAGPPLAGFVYEQTGSYDASFYLGGALLVLGGFCHLALNLSCVKNSSSSFKDDVFVHTITVQEIPCSPGEEGRNGSGSGVKPELVTRLEEVMSV